MKHFFALSLACVAMAAQLESNATVWRVNNQGFSANYTSLQVAIDDNINVFPGDTLHVEPSPVSYGQITLNRPFTLIGPGFFLNENVNPPLQANPTTAKFDRLIIPATGSGSKVMGIEIIPTGGAGPNIWIDASDILVDKCVVAGNVVLNNNFPTQRDNIVVSRCYVYLGTTLPGGSGPGPISNLLISNNYFGNTLNIAAVHQGTISHNVLTNGANVNGIDFYNNIVRTGNMIQNNNGITNVHHNIFNNDPGPWAAGGGNQPNVLMNSVFTTTSTTDGDWITLVSCVPCNLGSGGAEMGMFGGSNPYELSGIPAIPAIYQLSTAATAIQGVPLPVTISTRSND